MRLTCAGKVFIAGEYACIEGGPALVGTVGPVFSLEAEHDRGEHPLPFHELSPAGLYLASKRESLAGVRLRWHDPYLTPIGVGSSSAQFILSVAAVAQLEERPLPTAEEVLRLYWENIGSSQGLRPSGVDVLAQWAGGPIVARNEPCELEKLKPWGGKSRFVLAYTGKKAKTHEHLLKLSDRDFPRAFQKTLSRLDEIALSAVEAWTTSNEKRLGSALNAFQSALTEGTLAPEEFTARLERIQKWPGVLGCKGSGAQGGDCVLLLIEDAAMENGLRDLREMGWSPRIIQWSHDGVCQR